MTDPFESSKLLISHANDEIEDAESRIKDFFQKKPYAYVTRIDPQAGQVIHLIRLTAKIPGKISAIVKDAACNLRDALDHAVYASAKQLVGGNPRRTGFPFATDAMAVERELNGKRLADNPEALRPLLISLKPHEGGNHLLWGLNNIRNPNTHRAIVPVGAASTGYDISIGVEKIAGPSKFGYSNWDPERNEVEFMRIRIGSSYRVDYRVDFKVQFGGNHVLTGKPVIPTLREIAEEIGRVVSEIEQETMRIRMERGG